MNTKLLVTLPTAALAAVLCTPLAGVSILLDAAEFALLGGTAITNSGDTFIRNGDVGLWDAPETNITGFMAIDGGPGVLINGEIRTTSASTTQPGMDALIKVQNGLAGMPFDTTLSNQNLGGKTLLSGVYKFDAAADLTGNLVLDGNGQNDAFWVFQIGTSLTTAVNSTVTVINTGSNGGSDYGVFWSTGTFITTGADNTLLGNYLAGTSITFGANSSGGGRALAQAAVSLDTNDLDVIGGLGGGDWDGGLMYDESGNIVPIPEPATYAALLGLIVLAIVFVRRRRA